jgi:hypothetical protein
MLVKPISSPRLFVILICASIGMVGLYIGAVLPRRAQVAIGDNQGLIQFVSEVIIEHPDFLAYSKTQDDKVWGKPEGATIVAKWIRTN